MKQLLLALDTMIPKDRSGIICRTCGASLQGDEPLGHCLACLLDAALEEEEEPAAGIGPFDKYRLTRHPDGTPVELGRGAMGITYKAFDVDLRCTVTLKVIREKYVGDESTRLRFLREARAAASIRHPNVASVFHFSRTGENYFYAMEFVGGETLENLINCSGRLEAKTALEIATQVAAGLAAIHKQKLVHRDIKPSNIMVSMEEGGVVSAKIIDLGLVKAVDEPGSQTSISIPGRFAGTPEFASPEQFAGVGVDIRSDLYSLGVTLWEMITGTKLFRGSPAEVMYQHQHASLPLETLEGVPQPIVALLQALLEKDPRRRFQTPAELLKALLTITTAIDAGRTVTYQDLREMPAGDSYVMLVKLPARREPERISIARLPHTGSDVFDRENEIAFLNDAWENPNVNIVTIVARASTGKSTLVNHWLERMAAEHYRCAQLVFAWSFRQSSCWETSSADAFLNAALGWFGDSNPSTGTALEKGARLARLIAHRRTLLVLDALETLQSSDGSQEGHLHQSSIRGCLRDLAVFHRGLCLVTTRLPVADIADFERSSVLRRDLQLWQKWRR